MQMSRLRYDRLSYDTSGLLGPPGRWLLWFHGCSRSWPSPTPSSTALTGPSWTTEKLFAVQLIRSSTT